MTKIELWLCHQQKLLTGSNSTPGAERRRAALPADSLALGD